MSLLVIEKINLRSVVDLSIDKVHCCCVDEGSLQVMDMKELLRRSRCIQIFL